MEILWEKKENSCEGKTNFSETIRQTVKTEVMLLLSICYYYHLRLSFATDITNIFSHALKSIFLKGFTSGLFKCLI